MNLLLGKLYYADGNIYDGEWLNDMRHGMGTLVNYKDGSRYEGQWERDKRHGAGMSKTKCVRPCI